MRQFLGLKILILLFQQLGNDQLYFSLVSIFVADLAIAESASLVDKETYGNTTIRKFLPKLWVIRDKEVKPVSCRSANVDISSLTALVLLLRVGCVHR